MLENHEHSTVPKSENLLNCDNQQGKRLSYVIGVYFGDGYVSLNYGGTKTKYFRLNVIDEDFRDYAAQCCEIAFPDYHVTRFHSVVKERDYYGLQIRGIGNYIESITGGKRFIPNFVYESDENMKAFIEGMVDSKGWVTMRSVKNIIQAKLGFAITSEVIHELCKMLGRVGVKYGKIGTYTKCRKRALKNISINIPSFLAAGMKFHIQRKQEKLDKFSLIMDLIGNGHKHRRSFREQNPDLIKRMVCSDLCSDAKKMAEMSISAIQQQGMFGE